MDDVVCNQAVETLQEHSSKSVRHEVDKPNTEHLHSIHVVPARMRFKIEAAIHLLQDMAQQATHEGYVVFIDGVKLGNVRILI